MSAVAIASFLPSLHAKKKSFIVFLWFKLNQNQKNKLPPLPPEQKQKKQLKNPNRINEPWEVAFSEVLIRQQNAIADLLAEIESESKKVMPQVSPLLRQEKMEQMERKLSNILQESKPPGHSDRAESKLLNQSRGSEASRKLFNESPRIHVEQNLPMTPTNAPSPIANSDSNAKKITKLNTSPRRVVNKYKTK